jgi:hypothetical protein
MLRHICKGLLLAALLSSCAQMPPSPPPAPDAAVVPPPEADAAPPADLAPAPADVVSPSDLAAPADLAAPVDAAGPDVAYPVDLRPPSDRAVDRAPDVASPPLPAAPGLYFVLRAGGVPTTLPATVNGVVIEQVVLLLHELYLASDVGGSYLAARPADFSPTGVVMIGLPALRPGLYSHLQIKLEAESEGGGLPAVLMGHAASIYISGKTSSGTPFVIRDTGENQTGIAAAAPRDLKTGERLRATVTYDLERWFTGVTLSGEIDSSHAADQLPRIRSNLMQSAALTFD